MEYKLRSTVFSHIGTVSIDNEDREKWLKISPTVDDLSEISPTLDIDCSLIFLCLLSIILTVAGGVGVYYLYDLYVYWYPDHLFTHQRFIETYHLW